jgi:hypothetical protein
LGILRCELAHWLLILLCTCDHLGICQRTEINFSLWNTELHPDVAHAYTLLPVSPLRVSKGDVCTPTSTGVRCLGVRHCLNSGFTSKAYLSEDSEVQGPSGWLSRCCHSKKTSGAEHSVDNTRDIVAMCCDATAVHHCIRTLSDTVRGRAEASHMYPTTCRFLCLCLQGHPILQ